MGVSSHEPLVGYRAEMPLRLTANDRSLSGHQYDDVVGVRYEFPSRYRGMVREGERFVYYRGRRRADGTASPQVYLGVGMIGEVRTSTADTKLRVCNIEDWEPFPEPVGFKDASGSHYEPGAVQGGLYWRQGVKVISEEVFQRILHHAFAQSVALHPGPALEKPATVRSAGHVSPSSIVEVDKYAIDAAECLAKELWPKLAVTVLPHNNPGYDILVGTADHPERYIEVKGTVLPVPRFFMSEGQRIFSRAQGERYTLLVLYSIDLRLRSHRVFRSDGVVTEDRFKLAPRQWACEPGRPKEGPLEMSEPDETT